jgi:hypothetical protein
MQISALSLMQLEALGRGLGGSEGLEPCFNYNKLNVIQRLSQQNTP